jgi:hypothetical protein
MSRERLGELHIRCIQLHCMPCTFRLCSWAASNVMKVFVISMSILMLFKHMHATGCAGAACHAASAEFPAHSSA